MIRVYPTRSRTAMNHDRLDRWFRLLIAMAVLIAPGCAHIGPTKLAEQRLPYRDAVAESWKQQMLLNIVKLRYSDTIAFSEVSQIVNGHSQEKAGGLEFGLVPGFFPGLTGYEQLRSLFRTSTRVSDRPTITYTPQTGSAFLQQLARPLPPENVLYFLESDYPAQIVLGLTVESINGIRNRSSSGTVSRAADPEFDWIVEVLQRAQMSRSVTMRVKVDESKNQTTVLRLRAPNAEPNPELEEELYHAKQLLNLDPELLEYKVVLGNMQVSNDEIVFQTRPLLRILTALSQYVQVPQQHLSDGSVRPVDTSNDSHPLLRVRCSDCPPDCCFTTVEYRGCWFWIDDCDLISKRTFSYLLLLQAQADRQDRTALPLVTIPVN